MYPRSKTDWIRLWRRRGLFDESNFEDAVVESTQAADSKSQKSEAKRTTTRVKKLKQGVTKDADLLYDYIVRFAFEPFLRGTARSQNMNDRLSVPLKRLRKASCHNWCSAFTSIQT